MFGVLVSESLRPYDLIAVHQRDGECRQLFVLYLETNHRLNCRCDGCIITPRRDVGVILRKCAEAEQNGGDCRIRQAFSNSKAYIHKMITFAVPKPFPVHE